MRAGKLHQWITFQERVTTYNDYNEAVEAWQEYTSCNAAVVPLTAREFLNSAQVQYDATHKVTCRYEPGIRSAMRIAYGDRILQILSIIDVDEGGATLELICKEMPA